VAKLKQSRTEKQPDRILPPCRQNMVQHGPF